MSKQEIDKTSLEINLDQQAIGLTNKSFSMGALNTNVKLPASTSLSSSSSSQSSNQAGSPPIASSPDSVKAKLNGLLALSKKPSTNSLDLSFNGSLEHIDPNFLSLISSSSVILTPSPSPTPGF